MLKKWSTYALRRIRFNNACGYASTSPLNAQKPSTPPLSLSLLWQRMKNSSTRNNQTQSDKSVLEHPDAFHVSGPPREIANVNWRHLLYSTWMEARYKRIAMSCFIQGVYLLELDRQENRIDQNALASNWWIPYKYKLAKTLIDERDGSIFGAILEWDRASAMADFLPIRPNGAPTAVLAFRGTLFKSPTFRRDIQDDLRFVAWESLEGSVRFSAGLTALKSICDKYGSDNVCLAGHSLGAGYALEIGKAAARDGVIVETHLFNPPSVSVTASLRTIGERAEEMWNTVRSMLPYGEVPKGCEDVGTPKKQWIPNLYVNDGDYICSNYYSDRDVAEERRRSGGGGKMFVRKGKKTFLEAHGLKQWWSDDSEMQIALNNSKLISSQLKSLYTLPSSDQSPKS